MLLLYVRQFGCYDPTTQPAYHHHSLPAHSVLLTCMLTLQKLLTPRQQLSCQAHHNILSLVQPSHTESMPVSLPHFLLLVVLLYASTVAAKGEKMPPQFKVRLFLIRHAETEANRE